MTNQNDKPNPAATLKEAIARRVIDDISEKELLQDFGDSYKNLLLELLSDEDSIVRFDALGLMNKFGLTQFTGNIIQHLGDADDLVRIEAIEFLINWSVNIPDEAVKPLLADEDNLVRAYTGWALAVQGNAKYTGIIKQALDLETEDTARSGMIEALIVLTDDDKHLGELLSLLESPSYRARCFAANSLVGVATDENLDRIITTVEAALAKEEAVAVRDSFEKNLEILRAPPEEKLTV